jgi:hypothetical protein
MNLTHLLATSRSIMGIRKKPGPYTMSQEHLLPKFAPSLKPVSTAAPVAWQELTPVSAPAIGAANSPITGPIAGSAPAVGDVGPKAKRRAALSAGRLFKGLKEKWARFAGRRREGRLAGAGGERHVQTELSLETLKVVRSDLSDCDFEVVPVRPASARDSQKATKPLREDKRQPLGMVWNRLSARLLRQAAQEFNLVQKERGKLLSQAGNGDAGARGPGAPI